MAEILMAPVVLPAWLVALFVVFFIVWSINDAMRVKAWRDLASFDLGFYSRKRRQSTSPEHDNG